MNVKSTETQYVETTAPWRLVGGSLTETPKPPLVTSHGLGLVDGFPPVVGIVPAGANHDELSDPVSQQREMNLCHGVRWFGCNANIENQMLMEELRKNIAERQKVEEELRLYKEIVARMEEGVLLVQACSEKIVYANPKFEEMFGYNNNELINKHINAIAALTHVGRQPQMLDEEVVEGLRERGAWRGEMLNMRKEGDCFWSQLSVSTFNHPVHGMVWVLIYRDIGENKAAQEALMAQQEELRLFYDLPFIGMAVTSHNNEQWDAVNQHLCRMLGYPREELVQRPWFAMLHPDDKIADLDRFYQVVRGESDGHIMDKRFIHKDGQIVDTVMNIQCIRGEDGQVERLLTTVMDITDRKRTEMALREELARNRRFTEVLDSVDAYLTIKDHKRRYVYANRLTLELFDCTAKELYGATDSKFYSAGSLDRLAAIDEKVLKYGESTREEVDVITHSLGKKMVYLEAKRPIYDDDGNIWGLCGISTDITENKRIEEELRESEQRLWEITATLAEGLYVIDREGHITLINPAALAMLGWQEGEVMGRSCHALFHQDREDDDPLSSAGRPLFLVLEKGDVVNAEEWFRRKSGAYFPVSLVASPIVRKGEVQGAVVAFRDISERRQTEETLARNAIALEERIKESECLRDITNLSLTPGLTMEQMLDACVRRIPDGFLDPSRTNVRICLGDKIFQNKNFQDVGERLVAPIPMLHDKDGVVEIYHPGNRIKGHDARSVAAEGILVESIARQLGQSLERRWAEEKLHQAKESAEQAARAKSDFLSTMSHEIRTPINVVLGLTDVLLETKLSLEQRRYVETMHHSGGALMGIINDVLDVSRIEAGHFTLAELPFFPRAVVDETSRIMQVAAEQKGLTLVAKVDPGVPDQAILGDDGRVRQILINLIGNAIKFTSQGRITVCMSTYPQELDTLLFCVTDSGIGIAPQHLSVIFDRFTQADAGITRRYGGTGLGLAISRKLVELMGGRLWAESKVGQGSVFSFTLPCRPVEVTAPLVATGEPTRKECTKGLRILMAEDSEDNQILFSTYLQKTPHRLVMVNDGFEAVARVREESFDLVLMDIQMPILDGYNATRQIRQWETREGRPPMIIISLSAHASIEKREESLAVGCNDHLTKPIKKRVLLEALDHYARQVDHGARS